MNKKTFLIFLFLIIFTACGKKEEISYQTETNTKAALPSIIEKTTAPLVKKSTSTDDQINEKTIHGKNENQSVKGSCNGIETSSTCTEYIGDFWTKAQMEPNCKNLGTVQETACDNDFIGGCNIAPGTANENTIWYYGRGEAGIDDTSLKNLEKLCNRNPKAKWITK